MYRAANHIGQLLGEAEGITSIRAAGRSFLEAAYYVPVGNQNIGPISFRQGEHDNGKISFCLTLVGISDAITTPPAFLQILERLADGYVNGVRELHI